jgi:predicted GIY-YIG superfamily endonuclease
MSLFSEEQFNQILEQLNKLDLLKAIAEDLKQTNRKFAERYGQKSFENSEKIDQEKAAVEVECETKNIEHVRTNNESLVQGDDKSVEKDSESKSGENDQKKIDQKATDVIVKFRRIKLKKRRKSRSPNASLKVMTESTSESYLLKLQSAPSRVFMRKKKYKWDDGG